MKNLGTVITYNGKRNGLIYNGKYKEYPVGSLICEYARFDFVQMKNLIANYIRKNDLLNEENVMDAIEYMMIMTQFRFDCITLP